MKVLIVNEYPAFRIDLYIYNDAGTHVGRYELGVLEWVPHEYGTVPEQPTISFDKRVWEAIMREAIGNHPNDEILQDTRKVRDRLLTLVEQGWDR